MAILEFWADMAKAVDGSGSELDPFRATQIVDGEITVGSFDDLILNIKNRGTITVDWDVIRNALLTSVVIRRWKNMPDPVIVIDSQRIELGGGSATFEKIEFEGIGTAPAIYVHEGLNSTLHRFKNVKYRQLPSSTATPAFVAIPNLPGEGGGFTGNMVVQTSSVYSPNDAITLLDTASSQTHEVLIADSVFDANGAGSNVFTSTIGGEIFYLFTTTRGTIGAFSVNDRGNNKVVTVSEFVDPDNGDLNLNDGSVSKRTGNTTLKQDFNAAARSKPNDRGALIYTNILEKTPYFFDMTLSGSGAVGNEDDPFTPVDVSTRVATAADGDVIYFGRGEGTIISDLRHILEGARICVSQWPDQDRLVMIANPTSLVIQDPIDVTFEQVRLISRASIAVKLQNDKQIRFNNCLLENEQIQGHDVIWILQNRDGKVVFDSCSAKMRTTTRIKRLVNNTGDGEVIYQNGAVEQRINDIFEGEVCVINSGIIGVLGGYCLDLRGNIFTNETQYKDADQGDFALIDNSVWRDVGKTDLIDDYNSSLRPLGTGIDMGAIESPVALERPVKVNTTNKCYRLSVDASQGFDFTEIFGEGWVFPESRIGIMEVYTDKDHAVSLVFDARTRKTFLMANRTGPP